MYRPAIVRGLAVGLWLASALCLHAPEVFAHEGHDVPPLAPSAGDPNLVVRSTADEHYEVVLKYHADAGAGPTHATVFLSDFATNAPVEGARLQLRTVAPVQGHFTATGSRPGVYQVDLPHPQPGDYTLILTIAGPPAAEFAIQDLPLGRTVVRADAPTPLHKRAAFPIIPTAVAVTVLVTIGLVFARRRRARSSAKVAAAALLVAVGLTAISRVGTAHEGHDVPPATAAAGGAGPRYVPKESQFLLNVRTQVSRLEPLRERLTTTGHVTPESGALATVMAPQTGRFEREGQAPAVGDRVREGQLLGYLLVIDRLPVRAPISGLVSEVNVTTGQWVQAGQPLMRVLDERRVRVEVPLFGEHLTKALKAHTASVHLSALPGRSFPAVVRGLAPTTSTPEPSLEGSQQPSAAPVPPLILTVSNTGGLLRPGMLVEVSIETGAPRNVLDVPESAVVYQESGPGVFVHTSPETFEYRPVGITSRYPGRVGITGDVKPGERVVTDGAYSLVSAPSATPAPAGGRGR